MALVLAEGRILEIGLVVVSGQRLCVVHVSLGVVLVEVAGMRSELLDPLRGRAFVDFPVFLVVLDSLSFHGVPAVVDLGVDVSELVSVVFEVLPELDWDVVDSSFVVLPGVEDVVLDFLGVDFSFFFQVEILELGHFFRGHFHHLSDVGDFVGLHASVVDVVPLFEVVEHLVLVLVHDVDGHVSHFLVIFLLVLLPPQGLDFPLFFSEEVFVDLGLELVLVFEEQRLEFEEAFGQKLNSLNFINGF